DDILRHVEIVRQQPRAGCRRRERGQALAVCAERVDCALERLAQFGRIALQLYDRRLLENPLHAQRNRIIDCAGDLLSARSISAMVLMGEPSSTRKLCCSSM